MSNEERRDSLADQAAAWIPPWQRPAPESTAPESAASDPATPDHAEATLDPATPDPAAPDHAEPNPDLGTPEPTELAELSPEPEAAPDLGTAVPRQGQFRTKIAADPTPELAPAASEPGVAADLGTEVPIQGRSRTKIAEEGAGRNPRGGRVRVVPEPPPVLDDAELRGALEAILLVVDEPVSELTLAQVLEQPAERVGPMLDEIAAGYTAAGHGFELRRAAGGWRLYTRPEYATYVERFVLDGQSVRLTQAALETLAVVAYRQPVTRSRISAIRGVNCDGVIRTLVSRGLIEECGTESDSGAYLYRTSIMFLEKLGLNSLDDLPPLAPFLPDDVEELADAAR
ncbi:SMC-Scp complex subunit ScpB [Micromonospora craniellae]|uniref:SMC-Scp complex subunit ScpB n=1 Tax=Micromonospora craniellae TaxID=2294034 RepID=A0A372FTP2_9ACTN|nr:SMC-Scp complex subunit ScpB [Micromonospora craniellae]QOC92514.1 SMC-Scp complex subunit ScpB [Micromonospora craniellae]RFS43900.1 SMC-Scp complex subunit ScpB [Micromonospora craniellae]